MNEFGAPQFDPRWADAIAGIESRGHKDPYAAITTNPNGKRALGKYQVMDFNVPEWTRAALGTELSPQQFLSSPDAQEAVFRHRFGSYVGKYGNPQDAASAWFTGGPLAYGARKSDMFGTTGNSYVAKFNRNLDGLAPPPPKLPPAPAQQPQAEPAPVQAFPTPRRYPQHGMDMTPMAPPAQTLPMPDNPGFFQRNALMQRDPGTGDFIDPRGAAMAAQSAPSGDNFFSRLLSAFGGS